MLPCSSSTLAGRQLNTLTQYSLQSASQGPHLQPEALLWQLADMFTVLCCRTRLQVQPDVGKFITAHSDEAAAKVIMHKNLPIGLLQMPSAPCASDLTCSSASTASKLCSRQCARARLKPAVASAAPRPPPPAFRPCKMLWPLPPSSQSLTWWLARWHVFGQVARACGTWPLPTHSRQAWRLASTLNRLDTC